MSSEKYGMRLDEEIVHRWRAAHDFYKIGDTESALDLYRALRRDHSVELFFEIQPPKNLRFVHPLGCVLGRANYPEYFVAYQATGIGSDLDGNRPTFTGPGVCLFPGARILGNVIVGSNVFFSAGVIVQGTTKFQMKVPDNSVVFMGTDSLGNYGWLAKPTKRSVISQFFGDINQERSWKHVP